ncbi:MAG: universal stress protein [Polaribacter sp.]|uniref:universal stress protein n=1 Tax=Polaribacter sp. TaxID=1920175 RepID=UPI003263DF8F
MKHILVPIGSTETAQTTLQYAIDFASEINADVSVFRAYKAKSKAGSMVNMTAIIERETNLYLRTMVNSVDRKNVDVKLISSKGSVIESVEAIDKKIGIDLIIVGAKSNSFKESTFLGSTAGGLVKLTNIAILAVPENYIYIPIKSVLVAFKSGIINRSTALNPLKLIVKKFNSKVNSLLVKTPNFTEKDGEINEGLTALQTSLTTTENATTFQGVLEHFKTQNPDMLCVFKRKRGFFKKLWEKNIILKKEFFAPIPLLILKGE